jgi:copper chaperone CopZ
MTILKSTTFVVALAITAPAFAQAHDHKAHDQGAMNHAGHAMKPTKPVLTNAAALTGPGATVKINGLICDFCVQALTKTFKKQAAVRAIAVDLNTKEVRLGFKPGMSLNDATIGKLIKDAGYNVVTIKRRTS